MFHRKGITPVVAFALLLVISVISVTVFNMWFGDFVSSLQVNVESNSKEFDASTENILGVVSNTLFFNNKYGATIGINDIKVGNLNCGVSPYIGVGVQEILLENCTPNLIGIQDVTVYTNKGVFTRKFNLKGSGDLSGFFVDSVVEGLTYNTSTKNGITTSQGKFIYRSGEKITFKIGDILLGTATARSYITPVQLFNDSINYSDNRVVNIVRLLLTLDEDNNSSNGIKINTTVNDLLLNKNTNFSLNSSDFENNISSIIGLIKSGNSTLKSIQESQNHISNSILNLAVTVGSPSLSFDTNNSNPEYYESVLLTWNSQNSDRCYSFGDWSGFRATSGTYEILNLEENKTYSLTCTGTGGSKTSNQQIVIGIPESSPNVNFTSNSSLILENSAITLTWNAQLSNSCSALGDWSGSKGVSGSEIIPVLYSNSTFNISCQNPAGNTTQSIFVEVLPIPDLSLLINTTTVNYGDSVELSWFNNDTSTCIASNGWSGSKNNEGSTEIISSITSDAVYNLTCSGPGGNISKEVSVTVNSSELSFYPSSSSVNYGGSIDLYWSSNSTGSCIGYGDWSGSKGVSGSETQSSITANKSYNLTCTGGNNVNISSLVPITMNYTYSWYVGGWSACNCGCGVCGISRTVYCQRADGASVSDGFCDGPKPGSSSSCNAGDCGGGGGGDDDNDEAIEDIKYYSKGDDFREFIISRMKDEKKLH